MNSEFYVIGTPFRTSSPEYRVPFYFSEFLWKGLFGSIGDWLGYGRESQRD